eukprot:TRINITY_DN19827_c0_g1_i1.p1 TRINITY_DN19827_c0_g1~~TRINITY_DN19827_c0_g1_i1.p1  ORF type:complete len:300 (+),score=86.03 TRINITY_DN19827_c0_g1_i1:42-902(+)
MELSEGTSPLFKEAMRNAKLRDEMVAEIGKAFQRYADAKKELMARNLSEEEALRTNRIYTKMVRRVLREVTKSTELEEEAYQEVRQSTEETGLQYEELVRQQVKVLESLEAEKVRKEIQLKEKVKRSCEMQAELRLKSFEGTTKRLSPSSPRGTLKINRSDIASSAIPDTTTVHDWIASLKGSSSTQPTVPLSAVLHMHPASEHAADTNPSDSDEDDIAAVMQQVASLNKIVKIRKELHNAVRGISPEPSTASSPSKAVGSPKNTEEAEEEAEEEDEHRTSVDSNT